MNAIAPTPMKPELSENLSKPDIAGQIAALPFVREGRDDGEAGRDFWCAPAVEEWAADYSKGELWAKEALHVMAHGQAPYLLSWIGEAMILKRDTLGGIEAGFLRSIASSAIVGEVLRQIAEDREDKRDPLEAWCEEWRRLNAAINAGEYAGEEEARAWSRLDELDVLICKAEPKTSAGAIAQLRFAEQAQALVPNTGGGCGDGANLIGGILRALEGAVD